MFKIIKVSSKRVGEMGQCGRRVEESRMGLGMGEGDGRIRSRKGVGLVAAAAAKS